MNKLGEIHLTRLTTALFIYTYYDVNKDKGKAAVELEDRNLLI